MKVENTQNGNVCINMANNGLENSKKSDKNKKASNTVYAGDLNLNSNPIESKKQQAQKQAMKKIMDQYKKDSKSDDNVSAMLQKKDALTADMNTASEQIKNLNASRANLKEAYGITDDSEEQKNLDLLEKSIYGNGELTEDEQKQLSSMGPLTDYQKGALKCDAEQKIWQQRIDSAKNGIFGIQQSVNDIAIAKLKSHPMIDAQKEALGILEDASKEVMGTLLQQAKETEDEKIKKNEDEIEKDQKEKAEEEAKKQNAADKEKAAQNSTAIQKNQTAQNNQPAQSTQSDNTKSAAENIAEVQANQQKITDDLKDFAKKQKMLEDDIKGIVVDQQA